VSFWSKSLSAELESSGGRMTDLCLPRSPKKTVGRSAAAILLLKAEILCAHAVCIVQLLCVYSIDGTHKVLGRVIHLESWCASLTHSEKRLRGKKQLLSRGFEKLYSSLATHTHTLNADALTTCVAGSENNCDLIHRSGGWARGRFCGKIWQTVNNNAPNNLWNWEAASRKVKLIRYYTRSQFLFSKENANLSTSVRPLSKTLILLRLYRTFHAKIKENLEFLMNTDFKFTHFKF
jgi:hypothetical protein